MGMVVNNPTEECLGDVVRCEYAARDRNSFLQKRLGRVECGRAVHWRWRRAGRRNPGRDVGAIDRQKNLQTPDSFKPSRRHRRALYLELHQPPAPSAANLTHFPLRTISPAYIKALKKTR
jgi:hypothetical protein